MPAHWQGAVLSRACNTGIMGAKQAAALIPLCHNIPLHKVDVALSLDPDRAAVIIQSRARTVGKTGVEMEAMTAVSVAGLTVYDMCKAVAKDIVIDEVRLEGKEGGKSGSYRRQGAG